MRGAQKETGCRRRGRQTTTPAGGGRGGGDDEARRETLDGAIAMEANDRMGGNDAWEDLNDDDMVDLGTRVEAERASLSAASRGTTVHVVPEENDWERDENDTRRDLGSERSPSESLVAETPPGSPSGGDSEYFDADNSLDEEDDGDTSFELEDIDITTDDDDDVDFDLEDFDYEWGNNEDDDDYYIDDDSAEVELIAETQEGIQETQELVAHTQPDMIDWEETVPAEPIFGESRSARFDTQGQSEVSQVLHTSVAQNNPTSRRDEMMALFAQFQSMAAARGFNAAEVIAQAAPNVVRQNRSVDVPSIVGGDTTDARTRTMITRMHRVPRVAPRRRPGRPRIQVPGQQLMLDFLVQDNDIRDDDVQIIASYRRVPANTRPEEPRLDKPAIPKTVEELYATWETTARQLIPSDASAYDNFIGAFGDETEEGLRSRRKEIFDIAKVLFEFKHSRQPGQQAMLKGREREGKTGALNSIALAALLLNMRVVILCAPNKVAPIIDIVLKLQRAGFTKMFDIRHTLAPKVSREFGLTQCQMGHIFVAALGTVGDLRKVGDFINENKRDGRLTVTLVDECDELTQGKGHNSVDVELRCDQSSYQHFITPSQRGEDDEDAPYIDARNDPRAANRKIIKTNIASASKIFRERVHKHSQVFACSATLSGYIMNPIGVFDNTKVTRIFKVFPKAGFTGIERFEVPEGCAMNIEGNMSVEAFKESSAVSTMLHRFYARQNSCDGKRLEPVNSDRTNPIMLRGMLFVSVSPKVNVHGGIRDIVRAIRSMVDGWSNYADSTLFVCFIGQPIVFFGNQERKMPKGASIEEIYTRTAEQVRKGRFAGMHLAQDAPFSTICSHCVVLGYNLTRRAMTAAFSPRDETGVLMKLQYVIFTAPKTVQIDAASQRITRASHDFAEHIVPGDYRIDVAVQPEILDVLKRYRKMEDDMVERQRDELNVHSVFIQKIEVYKNDLEKVLFSKRRLLGADLSNTGRRKRRREEERSNVDENPYLQGFKTYLENYELDRERDPHYAASSVRSYYGSIRKWFVSHAEIETIYDCVCEYFRQRQNDEAEGRDENSAESDHHDHFTAARLFIKYYDEQVRDRNVE